MNILINAIQYCPSGSGIAVNIRELFCPFTKITKHKCKVILCKNSPDFPASNKTEIVLAPCTYGEGLKRVLFQSLSLGKYCKNSILLTVDSKIPFLIPKSCKVMPLITDLAIFRMPDTYQASRVFLWKLQYKLLCKRAIHFLAVSEYTKQDIIDILGVPADQIDVIPCAAVSSIQRVTDGMTLWKIREKYQLPESYVLFVGNTNPRKNLERIIHAFDRVKCETLLPHELVIAGGQGWKFNDQQVLKDVHAKESIHFIGYVDDEDMPALYSAADLFAFPTLYEGFGIPVVEAQKCGVPVLASDNTALPETGRDGALYVDPYDEEEIARGIVRLLTDTVLREELVQNGFRNADSYSWEESAKILNKIIERYAE